MSHLIFVKPRFDVYRAVSLQIRAIFAAYTPIIEPLSLDEAYLDVTENLKGIVSATQIAETIRAKIRTETGLTASAGVYCFRSQKASAFSALPCRRSPRSSRKASPNSACHFRLTDSPS